MVGTIHLAGHEAELASGLQPFAAPAFGQEHRLSAAEIHRSDFRSARVAEVVVDRDVIAVARTSTY